MRPAEIEAFDQAWMNPGSRAGHISYTLGTFAKDIEARAWWTGEIMEAMVRMFDLTHDRDYLDHLVDLSRVVLSNRDDRRTDRPGRRDPFHGRVMPAWGAPTVSSGYLHHTSVVINGVYAYPIAAVARIVGEDPTLHRDYGDDAVAFVHATLETLQAFSQDMERHPDDSGISYYTQPSAYRTLLTESRCEQAYIDARNGQGPDGWAADNATRLNGLRRTCNNLRRLAGSPVAHNENHAFLMAMIEAWRAVDSPFHRERLRGNTLVDWARESFPMDIKRTHRWFERNVEPVAGPLGGLPPPIAGPARPPNPRDNWVRWHHGDGVPDEFVHPEDISHAELSMRYVAVLDRSIRRINPVLFRSGQELIDLSGMRQLLANTFLVAVGGQGHDLAHRVNGGLDSGKARDAYNGTTNGWLDLTGVDVRIYNKCREVILRFVQDPGRPEGPLIQKYLTIGNHASLLANKPARFCEDRSSQYGTPPAAGSPTACVTPRLGVHNIAYRDTSGRLHELWRDAATRTGTTNLTGNAGAPTAADNPFAYVDTSTNTEILLFRGTDNNVHALYWSTGAVGHDNLTGSIGAPRAVGTPSGFFDAAAARNYVFYRSGNGHLHSLYWVGAEAASHEDWSALCPPAPLAAGDPAAYTDTLRRTTIAVYRGTDGGIHSVYADVGPVGHDALSGFVGLPAAAGDPFAYYTAHDDAHQVIYGATNGQIYEIWWNGVNAANGWSLSAAAGAPRAAGDPVGFYSAGTNTKHVIYRSADGHLNELWWVPGGGTPAHVDLTAFAGAPPAADRPAAFTVEGADQHVAYRGTDNHIYEVRWVTPPPRPPVDTVLDLNGTWASGGTPGPVISARAASLTVNMSAHGRPLAFGSVIDSSTITVTFPDDATYTARLQPPGTIIWSNGSSWTKV